jgi:hypothetical protein
VIVGWDDYLDEPAPAATTVDRARIEARIGRHLPQDSWDVACTHHGQIPAPDRVRIPGQTPLDSVGVLLTLVDPNDPDADVADAAREYALLPHPDSDPDQPDQRDQSDQPAQPGQPGPPGQPGQPGQPGRPG